MRRSTPWRPYLALALLLVLPSLLAGQAEQGPNPEAPWPAGLRRDQPPTEVAKLLGTPMAVSRQVVAYRAVEQWHYGPPHHYRLTFDCFRGQRPRLQSIRLTAQ